MSFAGSPLVRHGQHVLVVATTEDVGWQKYEAGIQLTM